MSTDRQESFDIDGMGCAHCVTAVEDALDAVDGVAVEGVEIGSATVAYDPSAASHDDLVRAIEDAGYSVPS